MKTYTMNYDDPTSVMQDFHWGIFRPGRANMKPDVGDMILLTSKRNNYAVAMVGTVTEINISDTHGSSGPTHTVDWKNGPMEIDPNYDCVQSGYISIDDRADILAQMVIA